MEDKQQQKMIQQINTIVKGGAGIAALELTDTITETLTSAAIEAAGITGDTAVNIVQAVSTDVSNPIGIIDAILKAIVSIVTVWQLIKKPKPKKD